MKFSRPENDFIRNSSFSEGFKAVMENENITTIEELLKLSKEQLSSIPNFTFQMLVEYRAYLETNHIDTK